MYKVDINSDIGESFGAYSFGLDSEIISFVSSANIACGYHGGDPLVMTETVAAAKAAGVAIGAHPGFPDLMGFGRRNINCSAKEAKAYVQYQLGALKAFCVAQGVALQHCKPHGALYNMAGENLELALAIAQGIAEIDSNIILLGLSGSKLLTAGKQMGLKVASEVFADRAYMADGSLVPRSSVGAIIHDKDEAIERTLRMILQNKVTAITGEDIPIVAHSICVHGDNPSAVEFVKNIRRALERENILIAPLSDII